MSCFQLPSRGAIGLTWSTELYNAQMLSFPQLHNAVTKMVFAPPFYCHSLQNLNGGDHRHHHVHQGILLQSHQAVEIKMEACNSKKKGEGACITQYTVYQLPRFALGMQGPYANSKQHTMKYWVQTAHSCGLPFSNQNHTTSCSSSAKGQ